MEVVGRRETALEAEIRQYLDELNSRHPLNVYVYDLLRRALNALRSREEADS